MQINGRLLIAAGGEKLPSEVLRYCINHSIDCIVYNVENAVTEDLSKVYNRPFFYEDLLNLEQFKKEDGFTDVVFAGKVPNPSWGRLVKFIHKAKLSLEILDIIRGDNSLLEYVLDMFRAIQVIPHFANEFIEHTNKDHFGISLTESNEKQIQMAKKVLQSLSPYDIGQSLIIENKRILGIEGIEGTDNLIARIKSYIQNPEYTFLIKLCKVGQTTYADAPTIGLNTVQNITGLCKGIVIDRHTNIIDFKRVIEWVKNHNLCLHIISE